MTNLKDEFRQLKFQNFEKFKKLIGVKSEEHFLSDPVFKDYLEFHKKHRYKNSFYLKEILFESLSYPHYFSFYKGFKGLLMSRIGVREKTFNEWFKDFLAAGIVRRVSKTTYRRMARFDYPEKIIIETQKSK